MFGNTVRCTLLILALMTSKIILIVAYYVDHENRRLDYVNTFFDHLVNWTFAEQIYQSGVEGDLHGDEL